MERWNQGSTRPVRRTAAEWQRTIAEQVRSGLGVRAFAVQNGLKPATLAWWKSALRRRAAVPPAAPDSGPSFVELVARRGTLGSAAGFEAVLTCGVVLRAPADVEVAAFARCVAALERTC